MFKKLLAGALLLAPVCAKASNRTYGAYLINDPTISYSTAPSLNLDAIDTLAFQAIYSSATISAFSFDDGLPGTGTFTVSKQTQMLAAPATAQITISSTPALTNATITINSDIFREGSLWTKVTSATQTAANLASAINANSSYDAAASSNVVYATAAANGSTSNTWTLQSSTPAAMSVTTWRGGLDNLRLGVNGVIFEAGTAFTPVATATGTARAISNAFMAFSPVSAIITSTWTAAGLVTTTATAVGTATNYTLFTSSSAICAASGMTNGSATDVSVSNDSITLSDHRISTGFPMYWTTTTGTTPTGLTSGATYYAIKSDANTIQLALTSTGSLAGLDVDITAVAGRSAFTLTPTAFAGTWYLYWQGSNDNLNWFTLNTTSVTYSTPGSTMWDGSINYRYLRVQFGAGTGGGMNLKVLGNGKKFD